MIGYPAFKKSACTLAFSALAGIAGGQTFQLNPGAGQGTPTAQATPDSGLGFGSNIGNARLARGAQLALERGDKAEALDYADRAARAAPNDPQIWLLLGYTARLNGRYGRAIDGYMHALKLRPGMVDGLSGLAQTYSLAGRTGEAERLLRQVISTNPGRTDDLLALGSLYSKTGQYPEAADMLGRAERQQPNANAELLLASVYGHLHQPDQAARYLHLAVQRAPNNPDVLRALAGYYREAGEPAKAVAALESIHNPQPDVLAELAYTYGLAGRLGDAARVYAQAANASPRDLGLQVSAAQAQVSAGSVPQAEPFLTRAERLNPNFYRLFAVRAEIAQLGDNDSEAARQYSAALAHLPPDPVEGRLYPIQLNLNLVALYGNLGEPKEAQAQLAAAQKGIAALDEQGPDRAAFLRLRALVKLNAGDPGGALADIESSIALHPGDPNSLQIDGDLLVRLNRAGEAIKIYRGILKGDPRNRASLTSLGFAFRAAGDDREAERDFQLLAKTYPTLYTPYLALGDLYTSLGRYPAALAAYGKGYQLAPENSALVAGGLNAALEAHDLPLAGSWAGRVTAKMADVPTVMREQERYLYFTGNYQASAEVGRRAIRVLPNDREVVVYLGYDLLHLNQYAELLQLAVEYRDRLPKEHDIPLLAGYVYKHDGKPELAVDAFTEALRRNPEVATAYVNRGFVLNDLHRPAEAAADFRRALKLEPNNGETHLGLAYAELNLHHAEAAIRESEIAEKALGDGEPFHVIRATAYGRTRLLDKAAHEYRAALHFDPNNASLHLGLGNTLFAQQRYREALRSFAAAEAIQPENAGAYAMSARAYAELGERAEALGAIASAERYAAQTPVDPGEPQSGEAGIYLNTGQAFSKLGDADQAMGRFAKALDAKGSDRVGVRLAIARLMATRDQHAEAERQVALSQLESQAGDAPPTTGDQYVEAAGVFQQLHEYPLAQTYLDRADAAGASSTAVHIARANNDLALGDAPRAAAELAAVPHDRDSAVEQSFLLAQAGVYQQQQQGSEAVSSFAQAAAAAGEDQTAEQSLLLAGASEGYPFNPTISVIGNFIVQPIFEDSTVYVLDSKLNSPAGPVNPANTAELPLPRSSVETDAIAAYHLHAGKLPNPGGYVEVRDARGTISIPATNSVVNRNTVDTSANFGLTPTVHIGTNAVTFNTGVQGTLRRDSRSPVDINQNLFRFYTFGTTTSFLNAVSAAGYFIYETGPFTEIPESSNTLAGAINFRVGAPWSKTALLTGWGLTDQQFPSRQFGFRQNRFTSSYVGLSRSFGKKFEAEAILEDLRAWRIAPFSPIHSAIAQALHPAGTIHYAPTQNWGVTANFGLENTRGFHIYDLLETGASVSYTRPFSRSFQSDTGELRSRSPIRLSLGFQQESFLNFARGTNQQFRPFVSLTLF